MPERFNIVNGLGKIYRRKIASGLIQLPPDLIELSKQPQNATHMIKYNIIICSTLNVRPAKIYISEILKFML